MKTGQALYLDVASQIESRIMSGQWLPGQKLPSLNDLASSFGVSRAVIREACSLLVGSGLLELRHGDGTYVRLITVDMFTRPVHAALLLGASHVQPLLEVGSWLESGIASVAALRRTDSDCDHLAQWLFDMEIGIGSTNDVLVAEQGFHLLLADISGNEMAGNLLRILYQPLYSILKLLIEESDVQTWLVSIHRSLYDSVQSMEPHSAERQMALYRRTLQDRARKLNDQPAL